MSEDFLHCKVSGFGGVSFHFCSNYIFARIRNKICEKGKTY
jgi:hypothetical protein